MCVAIIFGLMVGMAMTLIVSSTLYATFFQVSENKPQPAAQTAEVSAAGDYN